MLSGASALHCTCTWSGAPILASTRSGRLQQAVLLLELCFHEQYIGSRRLSCRLGQSTPIPKSEQQQVLDLVRLAVQSSTNSSIQNAKHFPATTAMSRAPSTATAAVLTLPVWQQRQLVPCTAYTHVLLHSSSVGKCQASG